MPDPESDRLLSAFRSLSDSRDRVRPGLEQLEQRITARRRRIRRAVTGGGAAVLALVIVLAVALTPGSGSQTRIATQPDPDAGITPTSPFCTVAAAIQKENATPLTSIPNPIDQATRSLHQTQRLTAVAPLGLQPALYSMTAALLDDISRGPTAPTTLVPQGARLRLVDQALSRCGLSIDIFGTSVSSSPAGGTEMPTTTLASATFGLCRLQELTDAPEYVGLSLAQANVLARRRSEHVRVENLDGRAIGGLSDREPNRVDVSVQSDRITEACHE